MKVAIFSDLHVHAWQEFSINDSRLLACISVLTDIRRYCREHDIGVVVFGGDLFHKRAVVSTHPYNLVVHELVKFKKAGIEVLAVDVNHDHANKTGTVHPLTALADAGLVWAVSGRGWETWRLGDGSDDLVVCGFSFTDNRETFKERVDASTKLVRAEYKRVPRIGVFHHGFVGAQVGSALEYTVREDIDPADLKSRWDFLFSGHYHQRQLIGGDESMLYIGSPLEHVRGDGGLAKGFIVYDSQSATWKLVELPRPRFVKLTQEQIETNTYTHIPGNFVDVVYEELPKAWEDFAQELRDLRGAVGVKPVPVKAAKVGTSRLAIDTSLGTTEVLTRYVDFKKPGGDRAELLRLGTEYITRVGE